MSDLESTIKPDHLKMVRLESPWNSLQFSGQLIAEGICSEGYDICILKHAGCLRDDLLPLENETISYLENTTAMCNIFNVLDAQQSLNMKKRKTLGLKIGGCLSKCVLK